MLASRERLVCETNGVFDPASLLDARQRIVASIVRRQGQPGFRAALIDAYGGRCAISDCDVIEILEAAHILPYHGPATNRLPNGRLLRGDLHTLFDLGLIAIDSSSRAVVIATTLAQSSYADLAGMRLRDPREDAARPSPAAIDHHRAWAGL
jgi:predicted restriction endonuclease